MDEINERLARLEVLMTTCEKSLSDLNQSLQKLSNHFSSSEKQVEEIQKTIAKMEIYFKILGVLGTLTLGLVFTLLGSILRGLI
jgi:uncharacterized protein YlxW (UPF0749 family)